MSNLNKHYAFLVILLIALGAYTFKSPNNPNDSGMLPNQNMLHIGIVVYDIEKSIDKWQQMFGFNKRPEIIIAAGHPINPTQFRGEPSNAQAKLAFIHLDNIQVELIEPIGEENSYWKEYLDQFGQCVHHAGFQVDSLGENYMELFAKKGYPVMQHGGWDGGEYGYMDTQADLGIVLELLESYSD